METFSKIRYSRVQNNRSNMLIQADPLWVIGASALTGLLSAYLATKRGKNPYLYFLVGFAFGLLGAFFLFLSPQKKKQPAPESPPLPIPTITGPVDKFWYYLDPTHERQGPISYDALTVAFRQKKIGEATYVWNEELTDWKRLGELVEMK